MDEDVELLRAWRAGDARAGGRLFDRHFAGVCRFFRSKLGDDVQDLIQRTFLDCAQARDAIDETLGFRAYLFGIARHRLVDELRRRARHVTDPMLCSLAELGTTPSQAVAREQEADQLQRALEVLPLEHRMTLELFYFEHMSGREVAAVLGVCEHTVRSRLSRARKLLRAELGQVAVGFEAMRGPQAKGLDA